MKPKVSVVIVVKNEPSIEETLASLQKQVADNLGEIIVVDASDTEDLSGIAARFPKVRWINYDNPAGKRFTIPEQRNLGIRTARGQIIVFIDAGGVPSKHWLRQLIAPILAGKEKITVGTIIASDPAIFNSFKRPERKSHYVDEAACGNLAADRSVYEKVDYFDENLVYGEDVDFMWRATTLGFRVLEVPAAVIAYDFGDLKRRIKRTIRYGAARAALYAKHPNRWRNLIFREQATVAYAVFIVGLPIMFWFPYYPLLLVPLVVKNIRHDPLRTIGNNMLFGFGVLRGLADMAIRRLRRSF